MMLVKVLQSRPGFLACQNEDGQQVTRKGGTVAWRNNNPGNLRESEFTKRMGSIGKDSNNYAIFPNADAGDQARYVLLFSPELSYYDLTIEQAVNKYAPSSDGNDTEWYIGQIDKLASIKRSTKLSSLTDQQRAQLLQAMKKIEGTKVGEETIE